MCPVPCGPPTQRSTDECPQPWHPHLRQPEWAPGVLWEMSPQTGHVTPRTAVGSPQGSGRGGGCMEQWVCGAGGVHGVVSAQGGGCMGQWVHRVGGAWGGEWAGRGCTGRG